MKPSGSIVVTGAGSTTAVGVIKGLMRQQEFPVHVVACDAEPLSAGAHLAHSFRLAPKVSDPAYLQGMLELCASVEARLLVPIVDAELMQLSSGRALFEEKGTRVAVSGMEALRICDDKQRTAAFFASIEVPAPRTWLPASRSPQTADFPVILKPRVGGRGSLGVNRAAGSGEYDFHLSRSGDCIVQEFIEGEEYTIDTLSDFDARPLAIVPRRRLEVRSGISYKGVVVKDERMIVLAERILRALKIVGPACIQCIARNGALSFIEVNPRFGGATAFTIAGAGVNTPLMLARAAWGERVEPRIGRFQEGATLLRFWDEVVIPPGDGAKGRTWS